MDTNQLTFRQFKALVENVRKKYKQDIAQDPDHSRHFTDSEMFGLAGFNSEDHHSVTYYLVRDETIRQFLFDHFKNDRTIQSKRGKGNLSKQDLLELEKRLKPRYLHNKLNEFTYKETGDEDLVKLMKLYASVYSLYIRDILDGKAIFECHYYSTKSNQTKIFELVLDSDEDVATVSHFHDNDKSIYETKNIKYKEGIAYLNMSKNGKPDEDQLQIILQKGKRSLNEIDIVSGSFSGVSMDTGNPIAAELLLVKKTPSAESNPLVAEVKKHLTLERNRFKVHSVYQINNATYFQKYTNQTPPNIDSFIGTHLIGRLYKNEGKEHIIYSVLRIHEDYKATLQHPVLRKHTLECFVRTLRMGLLNKVLLIDVHHPESKEVFIVLMILLSNRYHKTTIGKYCGITPNEIIGGSIAVYKLNENPDFKREEKLFGKKDIDNLPEDIAYEKILETLRSFDEP